MTYETKSQEATKHTGKHLELREGVAGNGSTVYMVITVCNQTGRWLHDERFKSKAEAENWMRWN